MPGTRAQSWVAALGRRLLPGLTFVRVGRTSPVFSRGRAAKSRSPPGGIKAKNRACEYGSGLPSHFGPGPRSLGPLFVFYKNACPELVPSQRGRLDWPRGGPPLPPGQHPRPPAWISGNFFPLLWRGCFGREGVVYGQRPVVKLMDNSTMEGSQKLQMGEKGEHQILLLLSSPLSPNNQGLIRRHPEPG